MYRSSPDHTKKKINETYTNILGLNGLNVKCFQEVYLDSCQSLASNSTSSPSVSPSSSISASETGPLLSPVSMSSKSSKDSGVDMTVEHYTALRKQQLLAAHQQHSAAAALAKHQLDMVSVPGNSGNHFNLSTNGSPSDNQQNEISKSLQMFAMLTAYSNGNENTPQSLQLPQTPVDAVMQDFACNGYVCDDISRFQVGMNLPNNLVNGNGNINIHQNCSNNQHKFCNGIPSNIKSTPTVSTFNNQQHSPFQQQNFNINFNNNFWKMLPTQVQQHTNAVTAAASAAAAATAVAAANIDYNFNQKKVAKRYNSAKNEKYSSAKHCVFCENNNEPEAVVKSHAVRDSLGRVLCPKLRTYTCPICKASGDMAHTVKYCPQKPIITMEDAIKAESYRLAKSNFYKQQMQV